MIDMLMGQVLRLILVVAVAVVVAQNMHMILSVLLAALFMLAIARLLRPVRRG